MALPLVQIGESVSVRVLREHVGIGDRQAELLEPLVRHGWMNLGCLERRRQPAGADEMFFRNEQAGAATEGPLRRLMKFVGCRLKVDRFPRRLRLLGRWRGLQGNKNRSELRCVAPNQYGGDKKKNRRRNDDDAIIMCFDPVHYRSTSLAGKPSALSCRDDDGGLGSARASRAFFGARPSRAWVSASRRNDLSSE